MEHSANVEVGELFVKVSLLLLPPRDPEMYLGSTGLAAGPLLAASSVQFQRLYLHKLNL